MIEAILGFIPYALVFAGIVAMFVVANDIVEMIEDARDDRADQVAHGDWPHVPTININRGE